MFCLLHHRLSHHHASSLQPVYPQTPPTQMPSCWFKFETHPNQNANQVISNYHHGNTWRSESTAERRPFSRRVLKQENSFMCRLIERAIKSWCHCRLYSFPPVYIIRTQRCFSLPVGTKSQVLRAISYIKRMFECALIARSVSEQVQTKKKLRSAVRLEICMLPNVPLGYWVSAAYLSQINFGLKLFLKSPTPQNTHTYTHMHSVLL